MSDLYLIAHRVRNEPAFDIAIRCVCRVCQEFGDDFGPGCHECDHLGYWWIIPTSGHRAYPWWYQELTYGFSIEDILVEWPMPPSLPDHYACNDRKPKGAPSLLDNLNLGPRPALPPIVRRI